MATSIAHSLIGLAIGTAWLAPAWRSGRELAGATRRLAPALLGCILLANAPDVDYLYGLPWGAPNRYHQTVTHTLAWLVAVAAALGANDRRRGCPRPWSGALLALALLASHVAIDWLTVDLSPPIGLALFWPFTGSVQHADGAFIPPPAKASWSVIWTWHNLRVAAVELAFGLPLLCLAWAARFRPCRAA